MHPERERAEKSVRIPIPQDVRWGVFKRDGYKCVKCGAESDLTVDHIIPVIAGGPNEESNFQTLCKTCNSRKGARDQ
ncbi:MAG: HNH endonuclease [Dehalococcoidia bacterium]|nr:HNH endonuclease [Dehalococcoidia bacterium]